MGATNWRTTQDGDAKYRKARAEAQRLADADGFDRGIEANDYLKDYVIRMLPRAANRFGWERSCEVVSAMDVSRCQPGHGPYARMR